MEVIKFAEATERASYTISPVPTTETDAIIVKGADVDSSSVISVGNNTQGTLFIDFTKGSLTNCIIKLYGSPYGNPDTNQWFTETEEVSSSGALTLNPISIVLTDTTTKKMWHFPLGANRAYKITVTGTGTNTGSSINLVLSLRSN
jgi:hypothetical protein